MDSLGEAAEVGSAGAVPGKRGTAEARGFVIKEIVLEGTNELRARGVEDLELLCRCKGYSKLDALKEMRVSREKWNKKWGCTHLKNLALVRILEILVLDAYDSSTVKHVAVFFWENLLRCPRPVVWIVAVP